MRGSVGSQTRRVSHRRIIAARRCTVAAARRCHRAPLAGWLSTTISTATPETTTILPTTAVSVVSTPAASLQAVTPIGAITAVTVAVAVASDPIPTVHASRRACSSTAVLSATACSQRQRGSLTGHPHTRRNRAIASARVRNIVAAGRALLHATTRSLCRVRESQELRATRRGVSLRPDGRAQTTRWSKSSNRHDVNKKLLTTRAPSEVPAAWLYSTNISLTFMTVVTRHLTD